jgi:hypothetical protein
LLLIAGQVLKGLQDITEGKLDEVVWQASDDLKKFNPHTT